MNLKDYIRSIPDYPKKGILFRDITTLIKDENAFSEAINQEDIQAVVIATPAETHFALAEQALNAGKDVYLEKPMTLSVKEAEKLILIADSQKRILMVGHLLLLKMGLIHLVLNIRGKR